MHSGHVAVTLVAAARLAASSYSRRPHRALLIMAARAEPLSIESLLQKQKEEKEAASKVRVWLRGGKAYCD